MLATLEPTAPSRARFTAFHATVNESWPPAGQMVHLGSWSAAAARMNNFYDSDFGPELAGTTLESATWKFHEILVQGRLYPHVLTDEQANDIDAVGDPEFLIEDGLPTGRGYQIFAYTNHCEDKGSVSWLVHASTVHVLSTHHTEAKVARWVAPTTG